MNSKGNYEQFRDAIAFRESSGDPTIENKYGYIGLYQFGEAALQDLGYYKGDLTKKNDWIGEWTGKNGIYSKDDFLNPNNPEKAKEIQNMVADEWFALLWKRIQRLGLDKYVGQTVDGIEITESGLIAAAHLKGVGALKKFLEGKLKNTKDAFGTDIREYLSEFGGYDISPIKNKSFRSRESDYANKVRRNVHEGSRRIDPLVIDLDGDGIKLVNINKSNAMFDLTGSGFANKTGWISGGDAFLVWDRNNDNRINDISEMFGNSKESGFQALSLYDTNRDGRIDAFDDVFKNLKLWQDRNGDGRTDEGELLSLSDVGIKSINLNTTQTNINQEGNTITEVGSVEFEDGRETQAGNVNFELDRLYSYYNREVELNLEIVGLPWVRGYGFMPDLPIVMSN